MAKKDNWFWDGIKNLPPKDFYSEITEIKAQDFLSQKRYKHRSRRFLRKLNFLKRFKFSSNFFLILFIFIISYSFINLNSRINFIEEKLNISQKKNCGKKEVIKKVKRSVVRVVGGEAEGSGFAVDLQTDIDSGGLILTNFHVIEFEPSPKIIFPDNTFETGEIIMADKNSDLAVIKVQKNLPTLTLGYSYLLEPGDDLIAIGFPLGGELPGEVSISTGALAGRRHFQEENIKYLQIDKQLAGGISGGPMATLCGEVVGINTSALSGMGFAISSDSIKRKWADMSSAEDPLKDIEKIIFEPNRSPLDAVSSFYGYLKVRKLEKAFELLSDNFVKGYSFEHWKMGYESLLDTSIIEIKIDEKNENIIRVKLSTKDFVDNEIVYKYFKGLWEVKQIDGKWLLWDPNIMEVEDYWDLWDDE